MKIKLPLCKILLEDFLDQENEWSVKWKQENVISDQGLLRGIFRNYDDFVIDPRHTASLRFIPGDSHPSKCLRPVLQMARMCVCSSRGTGESHCALSTLCPICSTFAHRTNHGPGAVPGAENSVAQCSGKRRWPLLVTEHVKCQHRR